MKNIEEICEKCKGHISVFEGYFGIEKTEDARLILSSERYDLRRDLYCSNGHDCEVLRMLKTSEA